MSVRKLFVIFSIIFPVVIFLLSFYTHHDFSWFFLVLIPVILIGYYDMFQKKHTIRRNFPVIGRFRYLLESIGPEIRQYFVESDIEGTPINRMFRSMIYQRAKKTMDTLPFGTQVDVYRVGYEFMAHSIYPLKPSEVEEPFVVIGGKQCSKPFKASLLNISAMSFGSLSKNAILALNLGAKNGNFYHNTGEGGISPYHLENGGSLVWQIGTGYFGCRSKDGRFDIAQFEEKANLENVKMIEIKLSQGAKPGHGGILPACKNTPEIAQIRGVEPYTEVISPPFHTAFSNSRELMEFIQLLRERSGGKPVGFKICIGNRNEFFDLCKAMIETGIKPDFITVDGGEGGTGAAPPEFSNSLGTPFRDSVAFVYDTLMGFDLKDDIKIIASGKIISGFHIVRALALGADLCNSARPMMMALGCIQALKCNKNTCPTGVATQNPDLVNGLVVKEKAIRVKNYHDETIKSFMELIAAAGLKSHSDIDRNVIYRRVSMKDTLSYAEIYPYVERGKYL